MLKIYNIKENKNFKRSSWDNKKNWTKKINSKEEFEEKINKEISKIINNFNNLLNSSEKLYYFFNIKLKIGGYFYIWIKKNVIF